MQGLQGGGTDTLANEEKKKKTKQKPNAQNTTENKTNTTEKNMTQLDLFSNPIQLK